MAASRFRPPIEAKEIMGRHFEPVKPVALGDPKATAGSDWPKRHPARYTVPTGRFTRPRASIKGLRNAPRKIRAAALKAARKKKEATP